MIDFGGLNGPGGPETIAKGGGGAAKPPTFWKGFWCPGAVQTPKSMVFHGFLNGAKGAGDRRKES